MKERPIIFNTEMVKAVLSGNKTQTRRVIKNYDHYACLTGDCPHDKQIECDRVMREMSPYGQAGNRLWVRETFYEAFKKTEDSSGCIYLADYGFDIGLVSYEEAKHSWSWRPSIHMPRWGSRINLEIINVKVEQIQNISEDDAKAEGVKWNQKVEHILWDWGYKRGIKLSNDSLVNFYDLWDSINEKRGYGWSKNPWVWVVEFKVI